MGGRSKCGFSRGRPEMKAIYKGFSRRRAVSRAFGRETPGKWSGDDGRFSAWSERGFKGDGQWGPTGGHLGARRGAGWGQQGVVFSGARGYVCVVWA